jgi:hypothetical protein
MSIPLGGVSPELKTRATELLRPVYLGIIDDQAKYYPFMRTVMFGVGFSVGDDVSPQRRGDLYCLEPRG